MQLTQLYSKNSSSTTLAAQVGKLQRRGIQPGQATVQLGRLFFAHEGRGGSAVAASKLAAQKMTDSCLGNIRMAHT